MFNMQEKSKFVDKNLIAPCKLTVVYLLYFLQVRVSGPMPSLIMWDPKLVSFHLYTWLNATFGDSAWRPG